MECGLQLIGSGQLKKRSCDSGAAGLPHTVYGIRLAKTTGLNVLSGLFREDSFLEDFLNYVASTNFYETIRTKRTITATSPRTEMHSWINWKRADQVKDCVYTMYQHSLADLRRNRKSDKGMWQWQRCIAQNEHFWDNDNRRSFSNQLI